MGDAMLGAAVQMLIDRPLLSVCHDSTSVQPDTQATMMQLSHKGIDAQDYDQHHHNKALAAKPTW